MDKTNEFNNFSLMQTVFEDYQTVLPDFIHPDNQLSDIQISKTDVEDVLGVTRDVGDT